MQAHRERAFYRAHWPRGIYSFLELRRIARELRKCARRAGSAPVDYRTALACIATAAQDWLPQPAHDPKARQVRDQLSMLATGLSAMAKVGELGLSADLHLAYAAQKRKVAIPAWLKEFEDSRLLTDLAKVAKDASAIVEVKKGQTKNRDVNSFLDQLVWQVEEFTGWRPTLSKQDRKEDPYGGKFIDLAAACLEPRGIRMSNHALGGAIERVLKERRRIHK